MGEGRDVYRVLIGKPESKRPLGRPRHRWEDSTETDLREIQCEVWTGCIWLRTGTSSGLL